jgi:hypothetical protein
MLTYVFAEVVSRSLLHRSYSNSDEECYQAATALGAVPTGTGIKKDEEGFACNGQSDRARRGCAGNGS